MAHRLDEANISRSPDIAWSGEAWTCSRQVKHYPSFCQGKTKIRVNSFVLIKTESEKRYIGYLEDLYEDRKGAKMIQVRWLFHNEDVKRVILDLDAQPHEVFITSRFQCMGIKCIDGPAAVLTPSHYQIYLAKFPLQSSSETYLCHRELNDRKITPFSLNELQGYEDQGVLLLLRQKLDSRIKRKAHIEVSENYHFDDHFRTCIVPSVQKDNSPNSGPLNLRLKLPIKRPAPDKPYSVSSAFDLEDIEFLSQGSGLQGCWFKGKVLRTIKKHIKVQYYDVEDAERTGKREEWIPFSRVAAPDNLGMRCAGRRTVRPWPPQCECDGYFKVGDAVDAWLGKGWWEGVVVGVDNSGSDAVSVYFPGENKFLTLKIAVLRPSADWIDGKWVDIKNKHDILSFLSRMQSSVAPPTMLKA